VRPVWNQAFGERESSVPVAIGFSEPERAIVAVRADGDHAKRGWPPGARMKAE
jgi:hypothetical protein